VAPLARALAPFDAWINGRKRYHGNLRASLPALESDGRRVKANPLARMSREEIDAEFARRGLPRHPLEEKGFASIGCMPCTARGAAGEGARAGRWRGSGKTECGIHTAALDSAHAFSR
jgi:phosphoadenosine phosphosulfate reductase